MPDYPAFFGNPRLDPAFRAPLLRPFLLPLFWWPGQAFASPRAFLAPCLVYANSQSSQAL